MRFDRLKIRFVSELPDNPLRIASGGTRCASVKKKVRKIADASMMPLVTVITVVRNGAETIEKTIRSVLEQDYPRIELIIIDGGSDDGTVDILRRYNDRIDYWVSEPDAGIYNAMNKGLSLSTGEIIAILNSDDFYLKSAISEVVAESIKGSDVVYGRVLKINSDGSNPLVASPLRSSELLTKGLQEMPIPHIAFFVRKTIYQNLGGFDESFRIAADHDFVIRVLRSGAECCEVQSVLAAHTRGGVSNKYEALIEDYRCAVYNGRSVIKAFAVLNWHILKKTIRALMVFFLKENAMKTISRKMGSRFAGYYTPVD